MSGTNADLIPIIIIPVVALAFMLGMIFYANSHPQWGSQAPADTVPTHALEGGIPAQASEQPRAGGCWPASRHRCGRIPPSRRWPAKPKRNSVMTDTVTSRRGRSRGGMILPGDPFRSADEAESSGGVARRVSVRPADSNGDSNVGSQPLPLTSDSIRPGSDLITRTGRPLRLKDGRSRHGLAIRPGRERGRERRPWGPGYRLRTAAAAVLRRQRRQQGDRDRGRGDRRGGEPSGVIAKLAKAQRAAQHTSTAA